MHTQTRGSTNTQIQRPNALAVMLWSSRADGPIAQPFFVFFCFTYLLDIKVLLALYQIYDSNTYRTALGFFYIYISMFEFILNFLKFSSYSQPELASYLQDLPSAHRLYRPWM